MSQSVDVHTDPSRTGEFCGNCSTHTTHSVTIKFEELDMGNHNTADVGKDPYRVSICEECGWEKRKRSNSKFL